MTPMTPEPAELASSNGVARTEHRPRRPARRRPIDVEALAERVYQKLVETLLVERERDARLG